ncbi:MAG: hypothetical protein GF344_03650, partial [Chitinivibrionales bacterium]|nr:hypothetical protein [Chitinivibrionales bacterium]
MPHSKTKILKSQKRHEKAASPGYRRPLILVIALFAQFSFCRAHEYFSFFYQRTTYLENLATQGAWWANPAVIASDSNAMFLATNVTPLGRRFLLAEGKAIVPIGTRFALGLGVLGAGDYDVGSSSAQASEGGFSYESHFAFERPRFQFGAGARHRRIGAVGLLATIGADGRTVAKDSTTSVASGGIGFGLLSPRLFIPLHLSLSFSFIHHSLDIEFWDKIGKVGLVYRGDNDLVEGSLEYSFDLDHGSGVLTPEHSIYDVLKLMVSVRVYRTVAALAGFSVDLNDYTPYYQGRSVHLGGE